MGQVWQADPIGVHVFAGARRDGGARTRDNGLCFPLQFFIVNHHVASPGLVLHVVVVHAGLGLPFHRLTEDLILSATGFVLQVVVVHLCLGRPFHRLVVNHVLPSPGLMLEVVMIHPGLDLPFEGLVRDLGAATPRHVVLVVGVDARAHLAPIQLLGLDLDIATLGLVVVHVCIDSRLCVVQTWHAPTGTRAAIPSAPSAVAT
mmetsp:Transcript_44562/g.72551  ORF Transcript_44562/g.72551 Transcript_44562/m.72551 type:complete len:203 (-) Transcript_44562:51-659(-)